MEFMPNELARELLTKIANSVYEHAPPGYDLFFTNKEIKLVEKWLKNIFGQTKGRRFEIVGKD